jgi:hypothetical protein
MLWVGEKVRKVGKVGKVRKVKTPDGNYDNGD